MNRSTAGKIETKVKKWIAIVINLACKIDMIFCENFTVTFTEFFKLINDLI